MKDYHNTTRDIARELARKYSTMTHDELDILESIIGNHQKRKCGKAITIVLCWQKSLCCGCKIHSIL